MIVINVCPKCYETLLHISFYNMQFPNSEVRSLQPWRRAFIIFGQNMLHQPIGCQKRDPKSPAIIYLEHQNILKEGDHNSGLVHPIIFLTCILICPFEPKLVFSLFRYPSQLRRGASNFLILWEEGQKS